MGVSNAWGQTSPHMFLIGEPVNTWTYNSSNNYPINNYYGQKNSFCIYVWMEHGQTFALHNSNHQYGPKYDDLAPLSNIQGNGEGNYFDGEKKHAWQYTGRTGLVRLCVDQSTKEWYPYVWVEELTNLMNGTEVMFYYGDTWNEGDKYLRTTDQTNSQYFCGWCGTHSNGTTKFGFHKLDSKNTYATCCKAPIAQYYISNNPTWGGIQMSANAEGGAMYSLTNNNGNVINVIPGVKPTWTSDKTTFKVYKGRRDSGIAATCGNSVINKANTIYYCYTQDNQNYHRFDPNDVSNLPLGTYTVWAIACDGHIAVRSAMSVELQIKNCTVKLEGTSDGQFIVKHNENYYTSPSQGELPFQVPYGDEITIVESKHNFSDIYNGDLVWKEENGSWQEFNSPHNKSITVNNDIQIAENFVVGKHAVEDKKLHLFLRIPKDLDKKGDSNNMGWQYNDGKDPNPTANYSDTECANFVWLTTGIHHEVKGSNIEERGCPGTEQPNGHFLMRPIAVNDPDFNVYHCTVTDSCWYFMKFERKHADSDYNNPPLMETEAPAGINLAETNCFTITGYKDGRVFNGQWEPAPNYTVELGYCQFGEYSVMCNGIKYTSTPNENVSFEAPYGSEITFVEGTPLQDIYKGGWMLREPNKTHLGATEPYIVKGNITFDDNFVTRNEHVFYLAVPDNLGAWNQTIDSKKAEYYIYTYDDVTSFPMYEETCRGTAVESYNGNGYKYYKFTLPAERSAFRFQHKVRSAGATNSNTTWAETDRLQFQVPTTEKNCYYLTEKSNDYWNGYWDILPVNDNQYRLLYVEQVVEKDKENNTVLTRKKAHPSDIFTKEDITTYTNKDGETLAGKLLSLHVYRDRSYEGIAIYDEEGPKYDKKHKYYTTKASNAGVILQKTERGKWVDISNNMVFGPLEAVPEVALLPGRKNAAKSTSSANFDYLYYDDGIENIKKDEHPDKGKHPDNGNGVWNFVVKKNNQGEVYIALDETHRYEGDYYIRTVAAEGGWNNYTRVDGNGQKTNLMTRSDISKVHSNYSHYFCKWIAEVNTDVQFTVANDYGCAISDTLMSDRTDLQGIRTSEAEKIVRGLTLPKEASVRFSWNEKTNFIHRAYLGGSTHVHERFLVLTGSGDNKLFGLDGQQLPEGLDNGSDPRYGLNTNEEIFNDVSNWVYYADVNMIPKAEVKLTADIQWQEGDKNFEVAQYFVGSSDAYCDTILNGSGSQQYHIRMLYDFKTNEIISAYVPGGNTDIEAIETNLMLIRKENNTASQMEFTNNDMQDVGKRSYGVIELSKKSLITDYNAEEDYYRVSLYWISFPFDVAIKDIFGFGKYGTHYVIQSYNGKQRAEKGLWKDSDTNWDYHFNASSLNKGTPDEGIMKKGVGYVLALDRDLIDTEKLFEGRIETIALYFPANTTIKEHIDNGQTETIEVPAHECTINRGTPKGDRRIKDSHWNVIGVPSYVNSTGNFDEQFQTLVEPLAFYYLWEGQYDKYTPVSAATQSFKSMNAYMVQYAGSLNWSNVVKESKIAAKRNTEAIQEHHLRLELRQNGLEQDRTFINLQEDEVTTGFDFNYDLCKNNNKGANIYSLIATETYPVEAAGNVIPVEEAVIPLGIKLDAAGEYTFAMPEGTDGIVVELIDYETNTRTNMLLDEYTINLGKGTFDNRFALHVKPDKTVTSVEDINTNSDSIRKFIIDGVLYMQKDGVLYDAQGKLVR